MSASPRETDESRPLLPDRPNSYAQSYRSVASSDTQSSETPEPPTVNKISRADLAWVLAGLWSAVFLGALDGACHAWRPSSLQDALSSFPRVFAYG